MSMMIAGPMVPWLPATHPPPMVWVLEFVATPTPTVWVPRLAGARCTPNCYEYTSEGRSHALN